ncbi:haloacid dehalogenase [Decorospora gaudefroyi]|uniref:Haloacid dehalogenase n=1 Tax=Decorospora gaudefroyi TaxID=184978 RepID=A0A6A5K1A4_9PLEO|nr:haloacid dehalogenase [Decorospora gaudefroyi]
MTLSPTPRALLFDVFGTCVNWRKTVVSTLHAQAHESLNAATKSLASRLRMRVSDMTMDHWGQFAQQWRECYKTSTRDHAHDPSQPWVSVDDIHLTSLKHLIAKWDIEGLWDAEEIIFLSLVWHRLEPWEDSAIGVELLNQLFATCTLSNGNLSLLSDLRTHSGILFTHLFSAEEFGTYKPSSKVYLGAVNKLGIQPNQCVMVAAHLGDLKAAKSNGLQAIYVERPGEEDWGTGEVERARQDGWVDLWVGLGEGSKGFITVAEKLGVGESLQA